MMCVMGWFKKAPSSKSCESKPREEQKLKEAQKAESKEKVPAANP